jgi:RNA-directed DNA polymerase
MIKAPTDLQELRRRIYRKTKSDKSHRFWGLFVHITKMETLKESYRSAKRNRGAPGTDRQSFADVEASGLDAFLAEIREELVSGRYKPKPNRRVDIPKANGKVRTLQIPSIRDRVVQGAVKLILEAIFEADFCPNSYGFRPQRSPHRALAEVRRSVQRRMFTVIDVDLSRYFDTIRHEVLLDKIARRVQDPRVLHLVKQIIKVGGQCWGSARRPIQPTGSEYLLERRRLDLRRDPL